MSETNSEPTPKRPSPPRRRTRKKDPNQAAEELRNNIVELQELVSRVFAKAKDDLELSELLKVLDTAGKTCSRIAALLKMDPAQSGLNDPSIILSRSMDEAIEAIRTQRGWR
jgi:regulator of sirC expression with transglutaminase-like and TPR domain